MRARQWTSRALALVALAGLSAACVSIPGSSSVRKADGVGIEDSSPQIAINVSPPAPGADPASVVQGFYTAMVAYPQATSTAREFLTPDAAVEWDPGRSLVVYQDADSVENRSDVTITATALGSLDERGAWTSADPERTHIRTDLHLVKVDGQWRIDNPEPGIFVDSAYFERTYETFSLYFMNPTRTILTPDPVHLAVGETTSTALVENLLLGPSRELAGVALSTAPTGTALDGVVTVSSTGIAEVPLSTDVLKLSPEDRQYLAAQLTWTLRQIAEIDAITITVDGADISIPNVGTVVATDRYPGYDPAGFNGDRSLYALERDGLVTVTSTGVSSVLGPIGTVKSGDSVAVDPAGTLAAIVTGDPPSVVVGEIVAGSEEGVADWFTRGTRIPRPSWDAVGLLWVVDVSNHGARVYAVTADGPTPVRAPGLTGRQVVSFAVSRDGVRLAAIVRGRDGTKLVISMVDRDPADPTKVSLRAAREVVSAGFTVDDLRGLAWVSPTSIAVIGSEPGQDREPYAVAIDGSAIEAATGYLPARPLTVAAGPNLDAPIAVGAPGGLIYVQTPDLQWPRYGGSARLRAPVYPG